MPKIAERWLFFKYFDGELMPRRSLNHAANAAAGTRGSIFEIVYRRAVPRLGHNQAIGAIAHRQCRLIWLIPHQGEFDTRNGAQLSLTRSVRRAGGFVQVGFPYICLKHLRTVPTRLHRTESSAPAHQ